MGTKKSQATHALAVHIQTVCGGNTSFLQTAHAWCLQRIWSVIFSVELLCFFPFIYPSHSAHSHNSREQELISSRIEMALPMRHHKFLWKTGKGKQSKHPFRRRLDNDPTGLWGLLLFHGVPLLHRRGDRRAQIVMTPLWQRRALRVRLPHRDQCVLFPQGSVLHWQFPWRAPPAVVDTTLTPPDMLLPGAWNIPAFHGFSRVHCFLLTAELVLISVPQLLSRRRARLSLTAAILLQRSNCRLPRISLTITVPYEPWWKAILSRLIPRFWRLCIVLIRKHLLQGQWEKDSLRGPRHEVYVQELNWCRILLTLTRTTPWWFVYFWSWNPLLIVHAQINQQIRIMWNPCIGWTTWCLLIFGLWSHLWRRNRCIVILIICRLEHMATIEGGAWVIAPAGHQSNKR